MFRVMVKVEGFGYVFNKEWGAVTHQTKIVEIQATILTIGIGIEACV